MYMRDTTVYALLVQELMDACSYWPRRWGVGGASWPLAWWVGYGWS